ncbi:unnamed protein product [Strongylus vulgaris]|uniref:Amiloride-sensitive sodium channel n=1 Tax=Strongylus vulgaris TaxID=40348 RepID=A0A3P7LE84_STRVU|nr:unnamed protein product [Strongylus vulgaris]
MLYRDFREFYDSTYGVCQTFNFKGNYTSSKAGPLFGLRMVVRTDQAKYLPWTETAGMDEVPFPDVLGYFAPPGTATSIGVRFVSTHRLPKPYGACTTQTTLNGRHYQGPYEVESCFRNCLQEKIIYECGCYDPAYPHANDTTEQSCASSNDTLAQREFYLLNNFF